MFTFPQKRFYIANLRKIFGITLKNGRNGIEWLSGKAFAKPDGDNGKNRVTQRKAEL